MVSDRATPEADVALWREKQFLRMGFERPDATLLAQGDVDWHQAERYLEQGCPHSLVLMLLLPVE